MERLCGLYARVSTEMQANKQDSSVDTQISRMKSFISYKSDGDDSWKIKKIYAEKGKSGKNINRPELQALFSDIKQGKINTVICAKIDRISRSLLDFYKMVDLFEKHNIEFISLDENFDTSTPMGKAALKITLVFAELEREQTSKRTKEKMAWRAEQGLWNGGQILGYDLVDKKLVINKKEAKLVKLMYEKYIELGSLLQVAHWLNDNGYRTKEYIANKSQRKHGGNKFTNTNVSHKLKSRVNIGDVELKGTYFKGVHKPIIEKSLFNRVNKLLDKQAPTRRNPKQKKEHTFILQSLIECGKCGAYMTTKYATSKNKTRHFYYQCTANSHGGKQACDMKYVPAEKLEYVIMEKIKSLATNQEFLKKIISDANETVDSTLKEFIERKKDKENKLLAVNTQIENLVDAIANNKVANFKSLEKKIDDFEEQQKQLEHAINVSNFEIEEKKQKVYNADVIHKSLKKFSEIYEKATPQQIKDLLPYFIKKIIFTPQEIKIALYDQPADKGLFVNHSSECSLELSKWLPETVGRISPLIAHVVDSKHAAGSLEILGIFGAHQERDQTGMMIR
ncbi:MAG: recombinase family protein, partial [Candidatus Omnitrophica bacterium]|nr:recombinase family protein [Candidatus Omnitrophota bacterium]